MCCHIVFEKLRDIFCGSIVIVVLAKRLYVHDSQDSKFHQRQSSIWGAKLPTEEDKLQGVLIKNILFDTNPQFW